MRRFRLVLIAMLLMTPFAVTAMAQDIEEDQDVGVGPALVAAPMVYGPPVCEWGYYAYYPYACAPYGYYGPGWFYGGVFIGVGPWYGWGWGWRHGWGHGGYGGPGTWLTAATERTALLAEHAAMPAAHADTVVAHADTVVAHAVMPAAHADTVVAHAVIAAVPWRLQRRFSWRLQRWPCGRF